MSMPAALDRFYTREEVLAFPEDGNRYELVHGELLVSPAPQARHQRAIARLLVALARYLEEHSAGEALMSPADISWGGLPDVLVQPDLFVVPPHLGRVRDWGEVEQLSLVIEVLSPTTARYDRFTKRRLYQEMRVPLYWLIDIDQRRAEVWTPEATFPVIETQSLTWQPAGASEAFILELATLLQG
ncbi:MAG: Uma2 family endonuclease [Gemmatimonadetes bacterium]|mgnify:FL=1|jgi:Uma2 family endonuclease|nr:Uma2 family endonuclease [Gemmatimonadota bacterium]MBK9978534.1 Uma2 family endonuclease [Gemmatimonadota bacterium]